MKEEFRSITLEWFNKAESDLDYARASFREFDRFYSQICILCHDAVEKYLKAGLASRGLRPKRTHDLVTLLTAATAPCGRTGREGWRKKDRTLCLEEIMNKEPHETP